jgi:hypothetical protein
MMGTKKRIQEWKKGEEMIACWFDFEWWYSDWMNNMNFIVTGQEPKTKISKKNQGK